jgi:uncharacterized ion transporter superfamily protein YfcC
MDMVDGMATTIWSKILLCNKWGVIRLIVNFSDNCDEKMSETVASTCLISWQMLLSFVILS